ncbi:uncharacterized protein BJ171DRAFT_602678 [Polychytrium aggregatum]|uniref:uncharacterized protein n=1 Tax=Polychytrium aggregatum TaxID=110093 RepID=UPI0022FE4368|nr:uncharacterized protein BJ171DRAFT_602678 [Polychytrium aggregatum]KAI9197045.1 hypothetical protein BJ171DRAFT_602678 [Polychytrium aggregatum]
MCPSQEPSRAVCTPCEDLRRRHLHRACNRRTPQTGSSARKTSHHRPGKLSKWCASRERILNNRPAIWLNVVAVLGDIAAQCLLWTPIIRMRQSVV